LVNVDKIVYKSRKWEICEGREYPQSAGDNLLLRTKNISTKQFLRREKSEIGSQIEQYPIWLKIMWSLPEPQKLQTEENLSHGTTSLNASRQGLGMQQVRKGSSH